ncbi:hypothetical protein [Actinoplanes sp. NPDC049599]|uniref:hypothetical protein n=1 Tax=Actinoplanes sp. NPDC049599 TaxID=3363903 RepID=UPI0037A0DAD5
MSRLRTTAGAVAGLIGLLAAFGPARPQSAAEPTLFLMSHGRQLDARFTVTGTSVRGLYPGAVKQLQLTIANPYRFALQIRSLSGRVGATSRRGCAVSAANLQVQRYTGRLPVTVPARGRTVLSGTLPITMPRQATAKCADTRFTIILSGTGTKAAR